MRIFTASALNRFFNDRWSLFLHHPRPHPRIRYGGEIPVDMVEVTGVEKGIYLMEREGEKERESEREIEA